MFKPVPYKLAKKLLNNGSLYLRVLPTPHLFEHSAVPSITNMVIFRATEADTWPTALFKTEVTKLDRLLLFKNVRTNDELTLDEGSVHFFLGMLVKHAEGCARAAGKSLVVMETELPHVTEWFAEYGWKIIKSDSLGNEKGYRGLKSLLEVQEA